MCEETIYVCGGRGSGGTRVKDRRAVKGGKGRDDESVCVRGGGGDRNTDTVSTFISAHSISHTVFIVFVEFTSILSTVTFSA